MVLHNKISLILFAGLLSSLGIGYLLVQKAVLPAFVRLEVSESQSNQTRVEGALKKEQAQLSGITADWAQWDATYEFAQGIDREQYDFENLNFESLMAFDADLVLFLDRHADLIWGATLDRQNETLNLLTATPVDTSMVSTITTFETVNSEYNGFSASGIGPLMLSARPIVTSRRTGPAVGTFVVAKSLNAHRIAALQQRTAVEIGFSDAYNSGPGNAGAQAPVYESFLLEERRVTRQVLLDLNSHPLLVMDISTPRAITTLGHRTLATTLGYLGMLAVLVVALLWWSLRILVVTPLSSLTRKVANIGRLEDLNARINTLRNDEIGMLAHGFDRLLEQLQVERNKSLEKSYKAGMAELAAGIMHNIRNTMTPMVNALDNSARSLDDIADPHLDQVLTELKSTDITSARADKLLDYLRLGGDHSQATVVNIKDNLDLAITQAIQIESILADQEQLTNQKPIIEKVNIGEVVKNASGVLTPFLNNTMTLSLPSDIDRYCVFAHRVGLLQIMGNLLLNACESIQRIGIDNGQISVDVSVGHDGRTRIRVLDNGSGIAASQFDSIFARGVTSKENGHGGLGLHWSANALDEMDGRIEVESPGPGKGAAFSVFLPAAALEVAA